MRKPPKHEVLPRCPACGLHMPLCLCDTFRALPSRTRVRLIVHVREARKSTNTARLLPLLLSAAQVRLRGGPGMPEAPITLDPARRAFVLFPSAEAVCVSTLVDGPPITLLVPDGNWRQATRAIRRSPEMQGVPHVTLPPGPPSRYRLRNHPDPKRISTFEAVSRALGVLEPDGAEVQARLDDAFTRFVERSLYSRGELAAEEVTGGVPDRWTDWPRE